MDFSKLRASSGKGTLDKLTKELEKLSTKSDRGGDDRFWYPAVDKAGNGYAVIRFLPPPGDEEVPFVRTFSHGFKGPTGAWYIENSLTTIGQNDPCGEINTKLWNSTTDEKSPARDQARAQKRKLSYISNVYVIDDKLNPENNGKVKLFKYGAKIFDKLNGAMNPQFDDETPINPFDFWAGANFKVKIRTVDKQRNYDTSSFSDASPMFDDDEKMETLWKQEHSLQAFLDASNFKTYEELSKRLQTVLGLDERGSATPATSRAARAARPSGTDEELPAAQPRSARAVPAKSVDDGDDEDMDWFKNLHKNDA